MTALTANTSEPSGPAEIVIRRVGVVGLGHMGHAFAVNLIEDGHHVSVYDRDPERAAAVTGARAAAQLADLTSCDVLVTSLPDDDALAGLCQVLRFGHQERLHPVRTSPGFPSVNPGLVSRCGCLS